MSIKQVYAILIHAYPICHSTKQCGFTRCTGLQFIKKLSLPFILLNFLPLHSFNYHLFPLIMTKFKRNRKKDQKPALITKFQKENKKGPKKKKKTSFVIT
jgi:hypothetical protein